ncbi:hypothetical protein [Streptosporangium sp. NPDC001681]
MRVRDERRRRIVVSPTAAEPERQRDEMSAFAQRFALPGTG